MGHVCTLLDRLSHLRLVDHPCLLCASSTLALARNSTHAAGHTQSAERFLEKINSQAITRNVKVHCIQVVDAQRMARSLLLNFNF